MRVPAWRTLCPPVPPDIIMVLGVCNDVPTTVPASQGAVAGVHRERFAMQARRLAWCWLGLAQTSSQLTSGHDKSEASRAEGPRGSQ